MQKFYIATSIVYTNQRPHIGFALEIVQADALARYQRILGREVLFSTGTDEHGIKNLQAAGRAGKTPQRFTAEISQTVKELAKALNISNDVFIRTSDKKKHWPTVGKVWLELKENGDIYKKKYRGLYCVGCEAFVTEKELVNGQCPLHKKAPEVVEEEDYFFRLSKYQNQLKEIIETGEIKIVPEVRRNELLSFISQGLDDVSCSRPREKLAWGIAAPDDKAETIYVWLEALVNYLSVADYAREGKKFKKFWPPDVHCIGKDIFVRFHGSLWPAVLLSLKLPLPKTIFVHGFITSGGQKMSKSLGNVVDPFELIRKYGADPVRYFLLREISPTEDGDFTIERFEERYNADLASGLGNLVSRVLTLAAKSNFKKSFKIDRSSYFETEVKKTRERRKTALDNFKFNEALAAVWQLIGFCDKHIEREKPWEKKASSGQTIRNLLFALEEIARMLKPFLPETSGKILAQIRTKKPRPLFPRLGA